MIIIFFFYEEIHYFTMTSILEQASPSDLAIALEANLINQVKYYGSSSLIKLFDEYSMVRVLSGLKLSIFNLIAGALLSSDDIDVQIEQALEPFRKYNVPMIWWVGPTASPADLGTHLENHGVKKYIDMAGMYYDLALLEDKLDLPDNFSYKLVTNRTLLKMWAETQTKAFEISPSDTRIVYNFEQSLGTLPDASWLRYIGFLDKKPVGVSILFYSAGVAAIFNVATVPEYRRRGIGYFMTKIPLYKARSLGYRFSVLKASEMGKKLYKTMNFQECCKIGYYYFDPHN